MQLFSVAFAVSIGLICVRANNGVGTDASAFQENFRNFFDSITNNNARKSEAYRDVLGQEAVREQRAFDSMKETLWRNTHKHRNLDHKSGDIERDAVFKREANENKDADKTGETSAPGETTTWKYAKYCDPDPTYELNDTIVEKMFKDMHPEYLPSVKLPKLPGRSDTFEQIREKKKIYVDKTKYIGKLLDKDEKFYFISRPAKFGKSMFMQTLRAFFVGNETLFRGLCIPRDHDWRAYSVIYFNFACANIYSPREFRIDLSGTVIRTGKSYGIKVQEKRHFEFQLRELILDLSEGRPESVVVLVDEYDAPVRRNLERGRKMAAKQLNECLESFFQLLLGLAGSLKLVMVTGVMNLQLMKFSSIVSNFCDITYDPEFSAVMGFTHDEMIQRFPDHVTLWAEEERNSFRNITESIRREYDSYCFVTGQCAMPVLNPCSIVSCFELRKIENYWHRTAPVIPDYIIKFFRENRLTTKYFQNTKVLKKALQKKYDFDQEIPVEVYLILHGYLTYRDYDAVNEYFVVGFPSKEVEETFLNQVHAYDSKLRITSDTASVVCPGIKSALIASNTEEFISQVDNLLTTTQVITREHPLTDLMECILRASFVDVRKRAEMQSPDEFDGQPLGDLDIETLNLPTNYVFEFKWRKTATVAMNQLLRYTNTTTFQRLFKGKAINLLAMNFCLDKYITPDPPVRMMDWIKVRYHDGQCRQLEASHSRYLRIFQNLTLPETNCSSFRNYNESREYQYHF